MNTLLLNLLKGFNLWGILALLYKSGGKTAVERFLTIPEKALASMPTANIPGRVAALVEERDEFVDEALDFLEAAVDADWTDTDPA